MAMLPRYSIYTKLLLGASVMNTAALIFDDVPSDTQFKEYLFKKILKPAFLKWLEDTNLKIIFPVSFLSSLFSLYKLFTKSQSNYVTGLHTSLPLTDIIIDGNNTTTSTTTHTTMSQSLQQHPLLTSPTGFNASLLYGKMLSKHPSASNTPYMDNSHIISGLSQSILNSHPSIQIDPATGFHYITRSLYESNTRLPVSKTSSNNQSVFITLRKLIRSLIQTLRTIFSRIFNFIFAMKSYKRLFFVSTISAVLSWAAAKFAWRIRNQYKEYAKLDLLATERDAIEYSHPSRPFLALFFKFTEYLYNPVFIGVEKILPYAQLLEPITPASSERLNGITLFKQGFVPFHEVVQTNEDLSLTIKSSYNPEELMQKKGSSPQFLSSPFLGNVGDPNCETPYHHNVSPDSNSSLITTLPPFSPLHHTSLSSSDTNYYAMTNTAFPSIQNNNETIFISSSSASSSSSSSSSSPSYPKTIPSSAVNALLSPAFSPLSQINTSSSSLKSSPPFPPSSPCNDIPALGPVPFKIPIQSPRYTPKLHPYAQLWDYDHKPRPLLFVANHTTFAFDMVAFQWSLCGFLNIYPRGLAHRGHFNFPIWSHALRYLGAISGTRELTSKLMEVGCPALVFPGGGREVMRKASEPKYDLFWGQRCGFAKVAIQNNAIIVPVAFIGGGENFSHIGDMKFNWLYGNYAIPDQTIPLDGEEKFVIELKLIKVRTRQLHQFGVITDLNQLSQWENDAIIQLCYGYQDFFTKNHLPIPDSLQYYLHSINAGVPSQYNNTLLKIDEIENEIENENENENDNEKENENQVEDIVSIAIDKNDSLNNKHKQANPKHSKKSAKSIKYTKSTSIEEEHKEDKNNNLQTPPSSSLSSSSSLLSSSLSFGGPLHLENNKPVLTNPLNNNTFFSTAATILTSSIHDLPIQFHPKPIPKIRQPNSSPDCHVTMPICYPTPNPTQWQRFYYVIGDVIDCSEYHGLEEDENAQRHLRDRVKANLEQSICDGKKIQNEDPNRYTITRWKKSIQSLFGF